MMDPFTDTSRWTLFGHCPCPDCRLQRDAEFRALLDDSSLTITNPFQRMAGA